VGEVRHPPPAFDELPLQILNLVGKVVQFSRAPQSDPRHGFHADCRRAHCAGVAAETGRGRLQLLKSLHGRSEILGRQTLIKTEPQPFHSFVETLEENVKRSEEELQQDPRRLVEVAFDRADAVGELQADRVEDRRIAAPNGDQPFRRPDEMDLNRRAFAVRGRVGYLGHDPLLYRDLSGRENLQYHARLHRVPNERVEELLAVVDMRERADDAVRLLSRGMVQRLAVCRTVLHRPQLLLLDEPRANLDPGAETLVEPLIGRGANVTRVLTSHDPQAVLHEADLVLGLTEGREAFFAAPDKLQPGQVRALYA
jgi:heme exporter protein A